MTPTGVTNLNNSIAGIADQVLTVRNNPTLKILLERFDNNSTPGNFTALLRAVERTMKSSGFQRSASADLISQLGGEFTGIRADLGLSGNMSNIGASVSARNAYINISAPGDLSYSPGLRPAAMPRTPGVDSSMAETIKRLGTTPDALAETIAACQDQNVARRVLSQVLLGNVLQTLLPEAAVTAAGATRGFSMEGMTSEKYGSLRASFVDPLIANGDPMNPHLYPSDDGLGINTQMLDALSSEIQKQSASGTLSSEKAVDLKNMIRMMKGINGVRPGPSQEKLMWRARLEQSRNPQTAVS